MVQQRSNRQPEQLIRQDGILITGQGPKNCDTVIFPAYGKLPVCETADRFQGFLLPCGVPPVDEEIFDTILYNTIGVLVVNEKTIIHDNNRRIALSAKAGEQGNNAAKNTSETI